MPLDKESTYRLREWSSLELPRDLTEADYELLMKLSNRNRIGLRPGKSRASLVLEAKSWIGTIQLDSFYVQILPKLPIETAYGLLTLGNPELPPWDQMGRVSPAESLPELIARLFCETLKIITRSGLHSDFHEQAENLRFVRGRILFHEDWKKNRVLRTGVFCSYESPSFDTAANRILASALDKLDHSPFIRSSNQKRILRVLQNHWIGIKAKVNHLEELRKIQASRLGKHYRRALTLASWILEDTALEAGHEMEARVFLIDMNRVFENYVREVLRAPLKDRGLQVSRKDEIRTFLTRNALGKHGHEQKPDIAVLEAGKTIHLLDAKYQEEPSSSEVKNLAIYLLAFQSLGVDQCDFIYPGSMKYPELILPTGQLIGYRPLDLQGGWSEVCRKSELWAEEIATFLTLKKKPIQDQIRAGYRNS